MKTKDKITAPGNGVNPSYDPDFTVPCTAGYEFITPELAKQMLGQGNRRNRRLVLSSVRRIGRLLTRREWMYDSIDAVGIATDGAVVNGQHRLEAIAEGDAGVWCLVARGVRPEVIRIADQNAARSLQQTLEIEGLVSRYEAGPVATAVAWIYRMMNHFEKKQFPEARPTQLQQLEIYGDHREVVDSLELAGKVHKRLSQLVLGEWAAYHYTFAAADAEAADQFFGQLAAGGGDESGPVLMLRERLIRDSMLPDKAENRLEKWQVMVLLVRAWEAFREGQKLAKNQLNRPVAATPVPSVSGVSWLGTAEG